MSRVMALVGVCVVLGCGNGPKQIGGQPRWRKIVTTGEVASAGTSFDTPITFQPTSAGAARYNDPPMATAASSPLGDAITKAVDDAAGLLGVDPPLADGRLFEAAAEIAEVVPDEGVVPYTLVEFALQHHGIIEPSPHLLVIWGPLDDPAAMVAQLEPRLPDLLGEAGAHRLGVGVAARDNGEGIVVLALQASAVTTRPIPRAMPDGGRATIEGEVGLGFADPEVFVTGDDGVVERVRSVVSGQPRGFAAQLDCDGRAGRQQVEITAVDASGSSVLANFPIWCNQDAPSQITVAPSIDDDVATEGEAEQRMLALVNEDRAAAGLPALAWDDRAAAVARGHSTEMLATGEVAHVSKTTGSASDRVKAAGIKTGAVLENIARAYGVAEAEEGLMNSPGHRANLMSKQVTHLGVGIVFGEEIAGRREMFVTQVFIRITPTIDPDTVREDLRDEIDAIRTFSRDADLDRIAGALADELAAGGNAKDASARASKSLERLASRFRRVGSVITTVADLDALDPATLVGDATSTHLGIGIAQGTHEDLGEGAVYIVLLLGVGR